MNGLYYVSKFMLVASCAPLKIWSNVFIDVLPSVSSQDNALLGTLAFASEINPWIIGAVTDQYSDRTMLPSPAGPCWFAAINWQATFLSIALVELSNFLARTHVPLKESYLAQAHEHSQVLHWLRRHEEKASEQKKYILLSIQKAVATLHIAHMHQIYWLWRCFVPRSRDGAQLEEHKPCAAFSRAIAWFRAAVAMVKTVLIWPSFWFNFCRNFLSDRSSWSWLSCWALNWSKTPALTKWKSWHCRIQMRIVVTSFCLAWKSSLGWEVSSDSPFLGSPVPSPPHLPLVFFFPRGTT